MVARQRLEWLPATVTDIRTETATAHTIGFDVPGWNGHRSGQHVDIRLTAEDGYSAQRSYSIASAPDRGHLELSVQRVPDGEVSEFLVDELVPGDEIELRGPIGGWFTWSPEWTEPVLLLAGGSGIVPLMAMVRERAASRSRVPFRLIYSARTPGDVYYAEELRRRVRDDHGLDVSLLFTRSAPEGERRIPGRITPQALVAFGWPPDFGPRIYVCGPTGFVETGAAALVALGHDPALIRTERFGPTGG